jgi:hypothetical protein
MGKARQSLHEGVLPFVTVLVTNITVVTFVTKNASANVFAVVTAFVTKVTTVSVFCSYLTTLATKVTSVTVFTSVALIP